MVAAAVAADKYIGIAARRCLWMSARLGTSTVFVNGT